MSAPLKCERCGASSNKRTGKPFTQNGLYAHLKSCRSLPQEPAAGNRSKNLPQEVNEIKAGAAGNLASLSSLEEEKNNTAFEAVVGEEKSESVAALWAKHRYDRDAKGRPVFSRFEHSLMSREWRYLTAKQRDTVMGIHAALRAHAVQVEQDEREALGSPKEQREREERYAQAEADRIEREAQAVRDAEFWRANGYMDPPTPPPTHDLITGEPLKSLADFREEFARNYYSPHVKVVRQAQPRRQPPTPPARLKPRDEDAVNPS
jgi:hypothetical protein